MELNGEGCGELGDALLQLQVDEVEAAGSGVEVLTAESQLILIGIVGDGNAVDGNGACLIGGGLSEGYETLNEIAVSGIVVGIGKGYGVIVPAECANE